MLVTAGLAPGLLGFAGALYAVTAAVLGAVFMLLSIRVWAARADGALLDTRAKALFGFSLLYLTAIFLALLVECIWMVPLPLAGG